MAVDLAPPPKSKKELLQEERIRCTKVGTKVAQKRTEKKMTQEELATMVGIDGETLRQNEAGTVRISAGRVSQIAENLEEPIGVFFSETNYSKSVDEMSDLVARDFKRIKSKTIQDSVFNIVTDIAARDNDE